MRKFIKEYAWCLYLGAAIPMLFDVGITDVEWWIFVVPLLVLERWSRE